MKKINWKMKKSQNNESSDEMLCWAALAVALAMLLL